VAAFAPVLFGALGLPEEEQAMVLSMIAKYLPIILSSRTILTNFLDSLTEAKIQIVLDQLESLGFGFGFGLQIMGEPSGPSETQIAIAIATIVDTLFFDGSLNTDLLWQYIIEGYYDFAMGGTFDPDTKAAVLAAFQNQTDQLLLLAHELAGADPSALTPDDIMMLVELRQRGQFLFGVLSGDWEGILEPVTFGYERNMFIQLFWNLGFDLDWNDETLVETTITMITEVFESSEEEAYYNLAAILNIVQNAMRSGSVEDVLAALDLLNAIGFTDEDIAVYLGNLPLALATYQQFLGEYLYTGYLYEDDLVYALEQLTYYTDLSLDIMFEVPGTLFVIADSDHRTIANQWWSANFDYINGWKLYIDALDASWNNEMWDGGLYFSLESPLAQALYFEGIDYFDPGMATYFRDQYNMRLSWLSPEELALYLPVLDLYEAYNIIYWNQMAVAANAYFSGFGTVSEDDYYYYDHINYLVNEYIGSVEQIHYYEDEVSYYTWMVGDGPEDLTWVIDFFSDSDNAYLWDEMAVILVEEAANLLDNISPEMLEVLYALMAGGPGALDLTPEGIAGYALLVSGYLSIVFDTITTEDEVIINDFLDALVVAVIPQIGVPEEDQAALITDIQSALDFYVGSVLYAPGMMAEFLAGLTAEEIQMVVDSIMIINALPGIDPDEDNMVRAVAIANIVVALLADGSLNTDFVIACYVIGYFDVAYQFQYDGPIDLEVRILLLQALIDDIILQADVIDLYDPLFLSEGEFNDVIEFHNLIELLIGYVSNGPEYEPIV